MWFWETKTSQSEISWIERFLDCHIAYGSPRLDHLIKKIYGGLQCEFISNFYGKYDTNFACKLHTNRTGIYLLKWGIFNV